MSKDNKIIKMSIFAVDVVVAVCLRLEFVISRTFLAFLQVALSPSHTISRSCSVTPARLPTSWGLNGPQSGCLLISSIWAPTEIVEPMGPFCGQWPCEAFWDPDNLFPGQLCSHSLEVAGGSTEKI